MEPHNGPPSFPHVVHGVMFGGLGFRVTLGLYGDNGKEHGNDYNGLYMVQGVGFMGHALGLPVLGSCIMV